MRTKLHVNDMRKAEMKLVEYQLNPCLFIEEVLGVTLHPFQRDIVNAVRDNRITAVKTCHSAGKSLVGACIVLWFLYCFHDPVTGCKVITTAPTRRQVEGILWSEIGARHSGSRLRLGGKPLTTEIKLSTNCYALGFTSMEHNDSKFQGYHAAHILVVVDEACGISEKIWSGIKAITTGQHARLLMLANPTNQNGYFGRSFDPKKTSTAKFTLDAFDTPNFTELEITLQDIREDTWRTKAPLDPVTGDMVLPYPYLTDPAWVREALEDWGEDSPMWDARVRGRFPAQNEFALIPLSWWELAVDRWHERQELPEAERWIGPGRLGGDLARGGKNSTTAALARNEGIQELLVSPQFNVAGTATQLTAGWFNGLVLKHYFVTECRLDADGYGAGPYDLVAAEQHSRRPTQCLVIGMRGGMPNDFVELDHAGDQKPNRYKNCRSFWFHRLRLAMDPSNPNAIAVPPNAKLGAQLTSIRYWVDDKGLICVEPKDQQRDRGLPSPDEADAVAYAWAPVGDGRSEPAPVLPTGIGANYWAGG